MFKQFTIILLFIFFRSNFIGAQIAQHKIDSLIKQIPKISNPRKKVDLYNAIGWNISYIDLDSGRYYSNLAVELSSANNYTKGLARAYNCLGTIYYDLGDSRKAIDFHLKSYKEYQKAKDQNGIAISYCNLGTIYFDNERYSTAKKYFLMSRKLLEKDPTRIGYVLGLDISLYSVYLAEKDMENARISVLNAYDNRHKVKEDDAVLGSVYLTMAEYYLVNREVDSAFFFGLKAEDVFQKIGSDYDLFKVASFLGEVYYKKKEYHKAISILNGALNEYQESTSIVNVAHTHDHLSKAYFQIKNYKLAYRHLKDFFDIQESIRLQKMEDEIANIESNYREEKNKLVISNLQIKNKLKDKEIDKKASQTLALIIGLLFAAAIIFIVFYAYRTKSKSENQIAVQKKLIEDEKRTIELKNKEITDSINYAKRLQDAILPTSEQLSHAFPKNFLFYKPKDIVAGDFYWLHKTENETFMAVADCTGHGVPGAMVSIVCTSALSRSILEHGLTEVDDVLNKTNELVQRHFGDNIDSIRDGMDIILVKQNKATNTIEFAGANNPLLTMNKLGEFNYHKVDKQPIGKYGTKKDFTKQTIDCTNLSRIFLITDGFVDQFGGERGKKLKSVGLLAALVTFKENSIEDHQRLLSSFINHWQGNQEQVDDICIFGFDC